MMKIDMSFLIDTMHELIETPSPVGYYVKMKPVIERYAAELGLSVCYDNRNTAYITLEGEDPSKTVCLSAHADTLGLMVRGFNADGTLRIRALGGVHFISCEGETVTNPRHAAALRSAAERVGIAADALKSGLTPDVAVSDVEAALTHLEELTGKTASDQVLARIFERFCVGK